MGKAKFNLKPESDPRLIMLVYRVSGKKFQYSTSQKVPGKFWDKDKCRVRALGQFPAHRSINDLLNDLAYTTEEAHRTFLTIHKNDKVPPPWSDLRAHLKTELDRVMLRDITSNDEKTLFQFAEQLINERKESPKFRERTIKNYASCLNHLKQFQAHTRQKIDFDTIDLDFSKSWQNYLFGLGKKTNTVNSLIKNLRVFMSAATERGINTNMAFKSRGFQVAKVDVDNIYLTVDELADLFHLKFDNNYLPHARDLFLLGAFTGLRYSDFTMIRPENIIDLDGTKAIQITTQKTDERVVIPVHPFVRAILERNGWSAPAKISNQRLNEYIKECCKLAKWGNDTVLMNEDVAGESKDVKRKKWEMVSTHTARRSFATNAYIAEVPTLSIMKITGHKTEKQFLNYIKIGATEHARRVAGHDFFRKGLFKVG